MQFTEKACGFAIKMAGCLKPERGRWGLTFHLSVVGGPHSTRFPGKGKQFASANRVSGESQCSWVGVVNAHLERVPCAGEWEREDIPFNPFNDS